MPAAKKLFYTFSGLLNTGVLKGLSPVHLLLPYHHLVSDEKLPHIIHLYPYKTVKGFENDLDFLLKKFTAITPDRVLACIEHNEPLPKNSFLLTFDDGLREIYDIVAPMLVKKGVPGIFFINSAFIDNADMFYRYKCSLLLDALKTDRISETQQQTASKIFTANGFAPAPIQQQVSSLRYAQKHIADEVAGVFGISFSDYLKNHQPYLTTEQIKTLARQGFSFGSHSVDHPFYDKLDLDEQLRQTTLPFEFLENLLGNRPRYFAFPHTDKGVKSSFFDATFTHLHFASQLIFGTNNQKTDIDPRILHRFNCENPDTSIRQSVNGILVYSLLHKLLGKNTVTRISQ